MNVVPGSIIVRDPRRAGRRPMLAVWCWCSRFFTVTPEEARRAETTCPSCHGTGRR